MKGRLRHEAGVAYEKTRPEPGLSFAALRVTQKLARTPAM